MPDRRVMIQNKLGLHARASARFAATAGAYGCDVHIIKEGIEVNGKSIMGILLLAAPKGTLISIAADGSDEELAMNNLAELIEDGFGED